jgi:integrase
MRAERPEMKVWNPSELVRFLNGTNEDRLSAMWRVSATTGVRRGELLGLRCRDVAFEAGAMRIAQQRVRAADGGYGWGAPKTEKGKRTVALDAATVLTLKAHRVAQARERLAWGPAYEDGDLVFCRENGTPLDPDFVTSTFEGHVRRLGLPRIRLHDLRHTHATMALAAGVHPRVVQERLGHASISVTLDTYSHSVPGLQEEAAGRIAALLEQTG